MQIIAFVPYIIGSYRFYKRKSHFMHLIALGIMLDVCMAIAPFVIDFPRMEESQGAPWSSVLFLIHITTEGIGMFGFIFMFVYLSIKGIHHKYTRLRNFQYKILLRLWVVGVGIALINFLIKVIFQIRIYDYL